jgi:hypothetical protein
MSNPIYIEYGDCDENLEKFDSIVQATKRARHLKAQGHARVCIFNESDSHWTDWCATIVFDENGKTELNHFNEMSKTLYERDYAIHMGKAWERIA